MTSIYWSALILGVVSNLHCFAMCGPIAMSVPINRKSELTILTSSFLYHTGRILTYSILGLLIGMIGFGIHLVGILQSLTIVAGIGIIIYAWRFQLLGENADTIFKTILPYNLNSKLMGKVMKRNSVFKPLLLGVLNGILPCGMVYTALITSLLAGNAITGSVSMIIFGLGTYPTMIVFMYVSNISNCFCEFLRTSVCVCNYTSVTTSTNIIYRVVITAIIPMVLIRSCSTTHVYGNKSCLTDCTINVL